MRRSHTKPFRFRIDFFNVPFLAWFQIGPKFVSRRQPLSHCVDPKSFHPCFMMVVKAVVINLRPMFYFSKSLQAAAMAVPGRRLTCLRATFKPALPLAVAAFRVSWMVSWT